MRAVPFGIAIGLLLLFMGCVSNPPPGGSLPPTPNGECVEHWTCGAWSSCVNGQETRTCADSSGCGTNLVKPRLARTCEGVSPPSSPPDTNLGPPASGCGDGSCILRDGETCSTCPFDCGACSQPPFHVSVSLGFPTQIYDSGTDRCGTDPIEGPDVPVKAIRNAANEIILVSSGAPGNIDRALVGSSFDDLRVVCSQPALGTPLKWPVEEFASEHWLNSPYTLDGVTVYALVDNEYHDPYAPNCKPGDTTPANPCWYNYVTWARSTDGGHTYTQPEGDQKLVAVLPTQWNPNDVGLDATQGHPDPLGYFAPSNIIEKGGYYYTFLPATYTSPSANSERGMCLMRTNTLNDPHSWKLWDGNGFTIGYANPYAQTISNPGDRHCALVSWNKLFGGSFSSVTYNTYLGKYLGVLTGIYAHEGNPLTCGVWFSLSDDLLNWTQPQLIQKTTIDYFPQCEPVSSFKKVVYPSIIDPASESRNYETSGQTPYLYYVVGDVPPHGSFSIVERRKLTFTKETG